MGRAVKILEDEPDWLSNLRLLGRKSFLDQPYEKNPLYVKNYERLSLDPEWLLSNTEPRSNTSIPSEYSDLLSIIDEPIIIHMDASPVRTHVPPKLSEKGLVLMSLEEALRKKPSYVKQALTEGPSGPEEDKLLGLIYASLNSGVLVIAPSGLDSPVSIRSIWLLGSNGPITSAATIVYAGEGTRLSIIEEYHSYRLEETGFLGHLVQTYDAPESQIRHITINAVSEKSEVVTYRSSLVGNYASHKWIGIQLGGSLTRTRIDNYLDGAEARADTLEASMTSGDQRLDSTINLHHRAESTTGRVISKAAAMQRSKALLKGIIRIERRAKNSVAYLAEHAMLLSSESRAEAIPGLEIECNEVRATHSASVSQIDPEQVWYMMTRGVPREEAVKIIALGFFEPLISEVDAREVRWSMRYLLERKWLGDAGKTLEPGSLMDIYVEPEEAEKTPEDIFGKHYKYVRQRG
ncbi:MAG: SufD family Fe-S cluster assembly protein [Nitrososphaerota archaeon]